jgi:chorismate synthase
MMNSFGTLFRLSLYGESHGKCVGALIDGCPTGMSITMSDFEDDLRRRMPGAVGTTSRKEIDVPEIKTGIFNGRTTGAPILIEFPNTNTRSADYDKLKNIPRPGHADLTSRIKYNSNNDYRGSGQFSGRMTAPLVAAGVIAKKIIAPVKLFATILEIGGVNNFEELVKQIAAEGDSIGGLIECRVSGVPAGLGEPFFDSVESLISHIVFSIPAIKGIEFGAGFASAKMKGSDHNDAIIDTDGKTLTNNSGGINGGISNGNDIIFRVAVKPPSSISLPQNTINIETGEMEELVIEGRHDACIALRMPVIIEAAAAIAIADMMLLEQKAPRVVI